MPDDELTLEELAENGGGTAVADPPESDATDAPPDDAAPADDAEPDTPSGDDDDVGEPDDDGSFMVDLSKTGQDWREKYGTPEQAIEGLNHLLKFAGQKNEDAQLTQRLRERLGEERFQQLVAGDPPPAAAGQPATSPEPEIPASFEDIILAQQAIEQQDARPEVRERALKIINAYQQRLHRLAARPEEVVSEAQVIKDLQARLEAVEKTATETTSMAAEQAWGAQHSAELYTADGELTPLGKRTQGLLESDPDVTAITDRVRQLNMALRLARGSLPKPKPTRAVPKGAQHQAGTNRGRDDLRSVEEQMDADLENLSEEAFLRKYLGREE
jgi:hypothetical protein